MLVGTVRIDMGLLSLIAQSLGVTIIVVGEFDDGPTDEIVLEDHISYICAGQWIEPEIITIESNRVTHYGVSSAWASVLHFRQLINPRRLPDHFL